MPEAITATGLSKDFPLAGHGWDFLRLPFSRPRRAALEGISFSVREREVFGLLGPNGSGKTTLLRVLGTLLEPSAGRAAVLGHDVVQQGATVRSLVGYCPASERSFYMRLSARENLRFYGTLNGFSPRALADRIPLLLRELELEERADEPVRNYSTGMLQRLSVVRALLHQPRVLLFDEPTHGLDPVAAASWRRYLREELVARLGCTILVATHNLREAEEVCSRLAILHRGRMGAVGTQAEVCRQAAASSLEEAYARLASAAAPAQPAPAP